MFINPSIVHQNKFTSFSKELYTNTIRLRLMPEGFISYLYLENSVVDEAEHQQNYDAIVAFVENGEKMPILIESENFTDITPSARNLARKLEPIVPISYRAIVIKTLGERILAKSYITFQKPLIPTKIFSTSEEAIQWLLNQNQKTA
jgi:hypothetical protein